MQRIGESLASIELAMSEKERFAESEHTRLESKLADVNEGLMLSQRLNDTKVREEMAAKYSQLENVCCDWIS